MANGSRRVRTTLLASQRGMSLVLALVALALASVSLALVGPRWADALQREKEQELLRVGSMYADALHRYQASSPGNVKQYPMQLEDLLLDKRFVGTMRHLRRLPPDPMNPKLPWGLVLNQDERVVGIYSTSERKPFSEVATAPAGPLPRAEHYYDWKFIAPEEPR